MTMAGLDYGRELETYREMVGSVNELNELRQAAPASHREQWDTARTFAYAELDEFVRGATVLNAFFSTVCEIEELGGPEKVSATRQSLDAMKQYGLDPEWIAEEESRVSRFESVVPIFSVNDRVVKEAVAYRALFCDQSSDRESATTEQQSFEAVSLGGALLVDDKGITGLEDGRVMLWEDIIDLSYSGKSAWTSEEIHRRCTSVIGTMLRFYDEVPTREMVPLGAMVRRLISSGAAEYFVDGWDPESVEHSAQRSQLSARIEAAIAKTNRLLESQGYPALLEFTRDKRWSRGAKNARYYRISEEYLGRVQDATQ